MTDYREPPNNNPLFSDPAFLEWRSEVDALLRKDWVTDIQDAGIENSRLYLCYDRDKESPAEFVERFAVKYDLYDFRSDPYAHLRESQTGWFWIACFEGLLPPPPAEAFLEAANALDGVKHQ